MTGLSSAVDAAVVLGGPGDGTFSSENVEKLPYGMIDILGNAFGYEEPSSAEVFRESFAQLSRVPLLKTTSNAPVLVMNGADDYFVPQSDTLVFKGRPNTEVHFLPGTGHCAMSKLSTVMPEMFAWLRAQFG